MKKFIKLSAIALAAAVLTGCGASSSDEDTIKVSATLEPHATILEAAAPILEEKYGYKLDVTVLDDYLIFNRSLNDGEVDANFFQHLPYFEGEVEQYGYDIVNAGGIHIEPFGIYSKEYTDVSQVKDGDTVIISNSVADNGRILSILASKGLIVLPEGKDILDITISDIDNETNNPKGLKFVEIKPELLVNAYNNDEGQLVAINGNYAIQGGLNPVNDSIILEEATQDNPYVNIVATTSELQDDEKVKALVEVLQSEEIQEFISEEYSNGSVIPAVK